ncbi:aspartate 1-decarboxylase autocleavage activator PanM [Psychromonas algicola]|uniref:aspartate 1-decarboxylase autocleavage activator PanM n=1 Tax=Psychromonas algicola TaxID=2555642 RepID=UPI00106894BA|nr:aspartate 1-decarboxylase autocleavage activator PanM [Psychromonas sp. RZ5]TEW44747.1 aspartate 1-decarboxylase autocleavage activator PanM [Psychromonas sp. RZ5]
MRLSVFIADQPSPQLIIDLQKIYSGLLATESLTEQAVHKLLSEPCTRLFMTMFNERHIGAVKVVTEAKKAVLSQLCIREITRRRGIGKNLLKQVETQLASEAINNVEYSLEEVNASELAAMQVFLEACGYTIKENIASKKIG